MYTGEDLQHDLEHSGIRREGTLLVHSSMKAIGEVEGGADTVLDVLMEYMKDGLLLFPTHTWSEDNLKDEIYDPQTEPSCVGLLSNLFMKRDGVIRSMHPTHSVAAIGKRAANYCRSDNEVHTPCPRNGCFGTLYDENAQILFLGASLKKNTYIHGLEEQLHIENRLYQKPRIIKIKEFDGTLRTIEFYGHYSTCGDVSQNYDKLLPGMLKKGMAHKIRIGDAVSYVVEVVPMTDWVKELLTENPHLFDDNTPEEG